MRKLWAFFRVSTHLTLAYRAESLVWFLLEFIGLVPMISLWFYLGKHGLMDAATVSYLVTYFLLVVLISRLTSSNFDDSVIEEIKDGNISPMLLKPFSYHTYLFINEATWKIFGLVYLAPAILILWLSLGGFVISSIQPVFILPAIVILLISFFQRLWVSWIIAITAFWVQQSNALVHLKWMLEGTFGGSWLPLLFFPMWFQSLARFTPFYYWYSYPIDLLLGKMSLGNFIPSLLIHLFWLGVLWWSGKKMWLQAVKKYSAIGN